MSQNKHYIGLNESQVRQSRKTHGDNLLTPPKKTPIWKLFIGKFDDPIIKILLIAALLSLGIGFIHNDFIETIGIFAAIILATGVAFWFEYDADKKFDLLNQVKNSAPIKIIRNNQITEVAKKDIVIGDIVIVNTGDEIPADGHLLDSVSLSINESSLTGELSVEKTTNPDNFNKDATYPSNFVLRSTKVLEGNAIFEVSAVGDKTEYGKVATSSSEETNEETPLNKQLDGLAKFIGIVGFLIADLTFITLFIKDIITGQLAFNSTQYITTLTVLFSVLLMIGKIWLPIIFDGISIIIGKNKSPKILNRSWFFWLLSGLGLFLTSMLITKLTGLNPIEKSSWIDINSADRILKYFMVSITLIVVSVPEGLPMSVTLSLALSMRRMLKSNNLVRKMHATETMGAATVICTDKTGTLTENQMTVYETGFANMTSQYISEDELGTLIKESIAINSTAHLDKSDQSSIRTIGNPTESALLLWLNKQNINYLNLREDNELIDQLSFSTEKKYMASIVYSNTLKKKILYVKGAPEIILENSKCYPVEAGPTSIKEYLTTINTKLSSYQEKAMRTLGFAYEIIEDNKERFLNGLLTNHNLTYLGVVAISDPIRPDVPDAVQMCLNAGIDVKIVTGDTPGTASEIGRQIGIFDLTIKENEILTGQEFEAMSDEEVTKSLKNLHILCRAKPIDKQRLVQLLQKSGEIVAVTGDGTNDAPALNHAHVGLSMGSGTSIAKEASDITILDDSFKSITTAVMWGRSLYQNIQKFIVFQLTINITAMIIVLLGSLLGHELPLTVTQMLWVNLIMDTFAAGALASLPPNDKVMKNKPRNNNSFIISKKMRNNLLFMGMIFTTVLLYMLFALQDQNGDISTYNLTIFFTTFVMLQFWNMFNVKAFDSGDSAFKNIGKSKGFITILITILIGQILIVEFGGEVFRTVPLEFSDWFIITGATSLILWIGEIKRVVWR
jgi:Ca2+-transporting ATPase